LHLKESNDLHRRNSMTKKLVSELLFATLLLFVGMVTTATAEGSAHLKTTRRQAVAVVSAGSTRDQTTKSYSARISQQHPTRMNASESRSYRVKGRVTRLKTVSRLVLDEDPPPPVDPDDPNYEDFAKKCLRGSPCACTRNTHGNPNCYSDRGDCPNHEGILCIW